jgi:hypothetical protein
VSGNPTAAAAELEEELFFIVEIVHVGQPHPHAALAQARHLGAYVEVVELQLGHRVRLLLCVVVVGARAPSRVARRKEVRGKRSKKQKT